MSAQPLATTGPLRSLQLHSISRTQPEPTPARRPAVTAGLNDDARAETRRRDAAEGQRDRALVARLQSGDREALAELYDLHGRTVYSIALSILRDTGRAEDVTQEVFITLWTHAERFDPAVGRFAPWFYRVARNRAIDTLRRYRREVMPGDPVVFELMLGPADDAPPETIFQRQDAERVRAALRQLPVEQLQLIELAYFEGLSQSQMATRLGIPLGTVKTRVRGGLRRLRKLLEEV